MRLSKEDILYEDQEIIVCHKTAGIATQTARLGEPDMVSMLKNYLKTDYIAVVHRLDQPVEGILVFAKTKKAAANLSSQNAGQTMNKQYYAAVWMPEEEAETQKGVLVDYLLKDGKTNTSKVVNAQTPEAKRAELSYEIVKTQKLETDGKKALVRIALKTGRHHQIRVQMANAGMPLMGDAKYASEEFKAFSREQRIKNVALCAYRLEFLHPMTGKRMEFQAEPMGEAFRSFLPVNS